METVQSLMEILNPVQPLQEFFVSHSARGKYPHRALATIIKSPASTGLGSVTEYQDAANTPTPSRPPKAASAARYIVPGRVRTRFDYPPAWWETIPSGIMPQTPANRLSIRAHTLPHDVTPPIFSNERYSPIA